MLPLSRPMTPDQVSADVSAWLASAYNAHLAAYKTEVRYYILGKICRQRDKYKDGSPEWKAVNTLLLSIGGKENTDYSDVPEPQ